MRKKLFTRAGSAILAVIISAQVSLCGMSGFGTGLIASAATGTRRSATHCQYVDTYTCSNWSSYRCSGGSRSYCSGGTSCSGGSITHCSGGSTVTKQCSGGSSTRCPGGTKNYSRCSGGTQHTCSGSGSFAGDGCVHGSHAYHTYTEPCSHGYTGSHSYVSSTTPCSHGYTSSHTVTTKCSHGNTSAHTYTEKTTCSHGKASSHDIYNYCSHGRTSAHTVPCSHGNTSSHYYDEDPCSHGYYSSHTAYSSCNHGYTRNHTQTDYYNCSASRPCQNGHTEYETVDHYYNDTYGYVGTSSIFYTYPINISTESGITTTTSVSGATDLVNIAEGNSVTITPTGTKPSNFKVTNSATGETTRVIKGTPYIFTMPAEPVTLTVVYGQDPQPIELSLSKATVECLDDNPTLAVTGVKTEIISYTSSNPEVAEIDSQGAITIKKIGTTDISIATTASDDWLATTKSVTLTITKTMPIVDKSSVCVSGIDYGNKLSAASIATALPTYKGVAITGSYAWKTPDDILDAGTHSCEIIFTPEDTEHYAVVTFSKDVVINQLPIIIDEAIKSSLHAEDLIYEQTLADSTIEGTKPQAGKWVWKTPSTKPEVSDSDLTDFGVMFVPDNANYATAETTLTLTVHKKAYTFTPEEVADLAIDKLTYGQTLSEALVHGTTPVRGRYEWVNGDTISPTVNGANSYELQFVPDDLNNYEIVNLGYLEVVVNKSDATMTAEQLANVSATSINYGQKLSDSVITAESIIPGTFAWVNPDKKPTVREGSNDTFEIIFTPDDQDNYNTKIIDVNVVVIQTPVILTDEIKSSVAAAAITYEDKLRDAILTGNNPMIYGEEVVGHYEWKTPDVIPTVSDSNTTLYEVLFIPDDGNYATASMSLAVTVSKKAFVFSSADIAALHIADITYGQSLADAVITGDLPAAGSFCWVDSSITPTVNGSNSFAARYIPDDLNNYEAADLGMLSVTVHKADPVTAEQIANISVSAIDYGQTLADSVISATSNTPGTFDWVNRDKKPTVQEGIDTTFDVIFTPDDLDNFNTQIISVKVKVIQTPIVLSEEVKTSVSTATTLVYGDRLGDAVLTGDNPSVYGVTVTGHYEWKTPEVIPAVSDSETTSYTVVFVPDDNNYANAEMTLAVKVIKKIFTFSAEDIAAITCSNLHYGQLLSESVITGDIPVAGEFRWKDGMIQPIVAAENNYAFEFAPTDTDNYEIVDLGVMHVNVLKADPVVTEEQKNALSVSEITYGQSLADSVISAASVTPGAFAWADSSIHPVVNDSELTEYEIIFTPEDTDNFNTLGFLVTVKVNPITFNLTDEVKGNITVTNIAYEDSLADANITGDLPVVNGISIPGHYEWADPSIKPSVSDSAITQFEAVFIPNDNNYAPAHFPLTITVEKKTVIFDPQIVTELELGTLIYGQTLSEATISGNTPTEGTYRWKDGDNITPVANDPNKYTIEFVPADLDNYEIVDVCEVNVVVNKANANITAEQLQAMSVSDINYGQKLSDSLIIAESVTPGSFAWEDEEIAPSVLEGASNTYNILFTPDDTDNYEIMIISVKVKVNPIEPTMPEDVAENLIATGITFGQRLGDSTVSYVGTGLADGTFAWKDLDAKPVMADSDLTLFEVEFTPMDNINYVKVVYPATIHVNKADVPEQFNHLQVEVGVVAGSVGIPNLKTALKDIPEWALIPDTISVDDPDEIFSSVPTVDSNGNLRCGLKAGVKLDKTGKVMVAISSRDYNNFVIEVIVKSVPRPTSPSRPHEPEPEDTKNPMLNDNIYSWEGIAKKIKKLPVDSPIEVFLGDDKTIPGEVIDTIAKTGTTVTFRDGPFSWTIDGTKLTGDSYKDINLEVTTLKEPADIDLRGVVGTTFAVDDQHPEMGLNVSFKKEYANSFANLYKKKEEIDDYEFIDTVRINDKGLAEGLEAYDSGEYLIMLSALSDLMGDVNSDTYVNAKDALLVLKFAVHTTELKNTQVADMNYDTFINAKDALKILKIAVGLVKR